MATTESNYDQTDPNVRVSFICKVVSDGPVQNLIDLGEDDGGDYNAGDYIFRLTEETGGDTNYSAGVAGDASLSTGTIAAKDTIYLATDQPLKGVSAQTDPANGWKGTASTNETPCDEVPAPQPKVRVTFMCMADKEGAIALNEELTELTERSFSPGDYIFRIREEAGVATSFTAGVTGSGMAHGDLAANETIFETTNDQLKGVSVKTSPEENLFKGTASASDMDCKYPVDEEPTEQPTDDPTTTPSSGGSDKDRIAGTDRIETAIEVSKHTYPDGAEYAFVARDDIYPDALAAGPLAAGYDGPILLTGSDVLPNTTENELERLDAADGEDDLTVIILGESAAVSDAVEAEIAENDDVRRVGGVNRFETAALIADELDVIGEVTTAYVATARDFPDAMVAGWAAGLTDGAVLLTDPDEVSPHTTEALADRALTATYVVGGDAVISDEVVSSLAATRIAGDTRYSTTVEVANLVFDQVGTPDTIYLTTGETFPDTLAVAPLAILGSDGIVLTMPDTRPDAVSTALGEWSPDTVIAIGGDDAVSDAVLAATAAAAG